jgi:hypothetical protein
MTSRYHLDFSDGNQEIIRNDEENSEKDLWYSCYYKKGTESQGIRQESSKKEHQGKIESRNEV